MATKVEDPEWLEKWRKSKKPKKRDYDEVPRASSSRGLCVSSNLTEHDLYVSMQRLLERVLKWFMERGFSPTLGGDIVSVLRLCAGREPSTRKEFVLYEEKESSTE